MPREPLGRLRSKSPVFVDRTGRRRRRVVAVGAMLSAVLLASLVLLLAGLFTGRPLPLPGWPAGDGRGERADREGLGRSSTAPTEPGSAPTAPAAPPPPRPVTAPPQNTATPPPGGPATPTPSAVDRPGRGDERRATPHGNRTKPPKPK